MPASALLQDAVELALRGAELTGGLLDPCIGGALESAGYDRDWQLLLDGAEDRSVHRTPSEPPRILARRRGGWREVEVDRARGTVKIPTGTKLDLGATAKALAADRACAAALAGGGGVLVSLGGDIAVRGRAPETGWRIHVTDDHRAGAGAPGQRISIESGGLATSSTTARRWRRGGEEMHHIIDPVSGRPAVSRWRTVSVAAADCTDANIASTGALLQGCGGDRLACRHRPAGAARRAGRRRAHARRLAAARPGGGGLPVTMLAASAGPSAYWYLTRSTGAVAIVLLTATVVLGVLDVRRWANTRWPRFVIDGLHRNLALLTLVFLLAHILTSVLDSFAPIGLLEAVVPFTGTYRPFWLGLGAVVVRPAARGHGHEPAAQARSGTRMARGPLVLLRVLAARAAARLRHRQRRQERMAAGAQPRLSARRRCVPSSCAPPLAGRRRCGRARPRSPATGAFSLFLVLWLPGGPLGSEWARRSGTPDALLHRAAPHAKSHKQASR